MKFYSVKSSAHRAAKQAGLSKDQYTIVEEDGKFAYQPVEEQVQLTPRQVEEATLRDLQDRITHASGELQFATLKGEIEGLRGDLADSVFKALVNQLAEKIARTQEPAKVEKPKRVVNHNSSVERPVKRVWHIADEMFDAADAAKLPHPTRKEVVEECVRRGIAFYTARTQYQQWWQCRNGKF